ncbi:mitochondrial 54S ribosomal protein YmL35 [Thecaphora frezii]
MASRSVLRAARSVARQQSVAPRLFSTSASPSSSAAATAAPSSAPSSTAAPEASSSSAAATAASATAAPSWKPLLPPGMQPAYDEALAFLSARSASPSSLSIATINSPSTLAAFSAGHYDASLPIHRHLREKVWRQSGILDKVMQRCTSMHVLPDLMASITPTVDVQVSFGQGAGVGDHGGSGGEVLAGVLLHPAMTVQKPQVRITAFHQEVRHYTLAIVDLDCPDVEQARFCSKLHLLRTDVAVSAATHAKPVTLENRDSTLVQGWIPPHPQKGSPYHRYVAVVLEQRRGDKLANEVALTDEERNDFDVERFAERYGLEAKGIHFWREKWSEDSAKTVSAIYRDVLKTNEPQYAREPNADRVRKQVGMQGSRFF